MENELLDRVKKSRLTRGMKSILIQTINVIIIKYQELHINGNELDKLLEQQEQRAKELIKKFDEYRQLRKEYESLNDR